MRTATSPLLASCGALLALLLCCWGSASGADAPDLSGRAFNITLTPSGGAGTVKDRLKFTAKELTCQALGGMKVPYTIQPKKKGKTISFEATITDATGGTTVISGDVDGEDVHGTIIATPKGGEAKVANYTSVKPGKK